MTGKPNLFMANIDVTLYGLNDQLAQINVFLNHKDTRTVDNVEHRRLSINSDGHVMFTEMKL